MIFTGDNMARQKILPTLFLCLLSAFALSAEEEKSVVAVLELTGNGGTAAELKGITSLLSSSIEDTELVVVIDRGRREQVVDEIKFSLSGLSDENSAVEIGKMLSADVMIMGSVDQIGSVLSIDLKAVDVSTTEILGSYYKIYENMDQLVDSIKAIGGQLTQNFTGQLVEKSAVFKYEEYVPLNVTSDQPDVRVYIDGEAVGIIGEDDSLTKSLNRYAEVKVKVTKEGYYPYNETIFMDNEQNIHAVMEQKELTRFAVKASSGGGSMINLYGTYYILPSWWFAELGLGTTVSMLSPLFIHYPISFRTGGYIYYDERKRLRPYGLAFYRIDPLVRYDGEFILRTDLDWEYLDSYGLGLGGEFKILPRFRIFGEMDVALDQWSLGWESAIQLQLGGGFYL